MICVMLNKDNAGTAAADDVLDTDVLQSSLQQTVKVLYTKQRQLEDEQKQVSTAFISITCNSLLITSQTTTTTTTTAATTTTTFVLFLFFCFSGVISDLGWVRQRCLD